MEIFSEKTVILVLAKFFRPPKLGTRFPPLVIGPICSGAVKLGAFYT